MQSLDFWECHFPHLQKGVKVPYFEDENDCIFITRKRVHSQQTELGSEGRKGMKFLDQFSPTRGCQFYH